MKVEKKQERNMSKIMAMLEAAGTKPEMIEAIKTTPMVAAENKSRQGDAVLMFIECPAKFMAKLCKRCGEAFGTNYRFVSYCSDYCRAKEMSEQLGVKWNYLRATEEERWGGEPPLIVPPKALRTIQQLTEWFSDNPPIQTQKESQPESTQVIETHLEVPQSHTETVHQEPHTSHTTPPLSPPQLLLKYSKEEVILFGFE